MTLLALAAALESGLIYALVALGVLMSFRILDFPDLTADGSFPLGGAVAAVAIISGINPWLACLLGMASGMVAGLVTAWLNVRLKILHLLASILVMTALWSINLRVMGKSNVPLLGELTIFTQLDATGVWFKVGVLAAIVLLVKLALDWFFSTEMGLAMRATGSNLRMAQAQGINTSLMVLLGMAISNGLIALAGALFVQTQGFADVSIGIGTIVVGLVAVILGEAVLTSKRMIWITLSVILGSVIFKFFIQIALGSEFLGDLGFKSQDLNLVTAILVVALLVFSGHKHKIFGRKTQKLGDK